MTELSDLSPAASYGDLITFSNQGSGVSAALNRIQDGWGNNTAIALSTTTLNVIGIFQVNGVSLIQQNGALGLPQYSAAPTPFPGAMYYNTTANIPYVYIAGGTNDWVPLI